MKFLTTVTTTNGDKAGPPPAALMQAINELGMKTGASLVDTGGMKTTAVVNLEAGDIVVDGPYTEAKEAVGGYAIYDLETEAEAVEYCRKFLELHKLHWPAWEGEVIVRQIISYMPPR